MIKSDWLAMETYKLVREQGLIMLFLIKESMEMVMVSDVMVSDKYPLAKILVLSNELIKVELPPLATRLIKPKFLL